jgi:hypothetical protein
VFNQQEKTPIHKTSIHERISDFFVRRMNVPRITPSEQKISVDYLSRTVNSIFLSNYFGNITDQPLLAGPVCLLGLVESTFFYIRDLNKLPESRIK